MPTIRFAPSAYAMYATHAHSGTEPTIAFAGNVTPEGIALELEAERIARELKLPPCPALLDQFHKAINMTKPTRTSWFNSSAVIPP